MIESFDVLSLDTNVTNTEALRALSAILDIDGNAVRMYGYQGVPELQHLQVVRHILCSAKRIGDGSTTSTSARYLFHEQNRETCAIEEPAYVL